jgi:hypothetical protein
MFSQRFAALRDRKERKEMKKMKGNGMGTLL